MYKVVEVKLQFKERIYGGLPRDEDVLKSFVQAKFGSEDTSPMDTDLDLTEETDKRTTQFRKDETGVYLGAYQVKAMLYEAAKMLDFTVKKRGSKQTLKEGLNVWGLIDGEPTGNKIYFQPLIHQADGTETFTGNVSTPQGNRSIIQSLEYVEKPSIQFRLEVLANRISDAGLKSFSLKDLKTCFAHGRNLGLGARRKYGGGMFSVVEWTVLEDLTADAVIDF